MHLGYLTIVSDPKPNRNQSNVSYTTHTRLETNCFCCLSISNCVYFCKALAVVNNTITLEPEKLITLLALLQT